MIILDTNVVSELMAEKPDLAVFAWARTVARDQMTITTVTFMELRYGIEKLPISKRRTKMESDLEWVLTDMVSGRMLNFDMSAAKYAAERIAHLKKIGQPVEIRDVQIAGVAMSRRIKIATRNTKDYEHLTVKVINPWGG